MRLRKIVEPHSSMLSHQDSNLGKQNQNLMCYHYTMGQSHSSRNLSAKILLFGHMTKFIFVNTGYQHH